MKQLIISILFISLFGCVSVEKKISNLTLVGKWQLVGEYCNEKGEECKAPSQSIIVEFTQDGFFIINRNRRNRASYSIIGNQILIERDKKNQKVLIYFLNDNTILTVEPDITSRFSRIKG